MDFNMEKKYKLTDETIEIDCHILHRIQASKDFNNVKKGDLGGFVEKEENLSQRGDAWIGGNAKVYDRAVVFCNARVDENAVVFGYAKIFNNAKINGDAKVYDNAIVFGFAVVWDRAEIYG